MQLALYSRRIELDLNFAMIVERRVEQTKFWKPDFARRLGPELGKIESNY